jgi:sugar phosphate isomerase/epimerase
MIENRTLGTAPDTYGAGHISYCDGDNIAIIQRFPERIRYVHLKQVDPEVRRRVHEENLSLAEAVFGPTDPEIHPRERNARC